MAAPSPGTPVQTQFATSVTSMAVNMPATVNSGDRLVTVVSVRNSGTWNTIPTGWSQIKQQLGGGSASQTTVFEKIAAGTEAGTTPTWIASTGTTAIWQTIRVTGAHASTASEVTSTSGDATAADPPSITPAGGSNDYLIIAVAGHAAASAAAFTAGPSGYTGFQNNGASSGGSAVSVATATKQLTATTTENPGAFTAGGSNRFWAAATIAVYPASGGAVSASVTQVAATVTAAGGTQVVASQVVASVTQSAASVTASGGTQVVSTVNIAAISQLAATVTATGGTQTVDTVQNASVAQVAATVTATGGTQVVDTASIVNASITQVAGSITASGGTQTVAAIQNSSVAQTAANVAASGGIQAADTSNFVALSQVAANVTMSGGTQQVDTVNNVSLTQTAANITASGGTQVIEAHINASVVQQVANIIATGGTQDVTGTSGVSSASIDQVAANITATGGVQVISTATGPLPSRKYFIDSDANVYWVINQELGLVERV